MTTIRKAEAEDLDGIMNVVSDVGEEAQKESRKKIIERITEGQLLCYLDNNEIIGFLGWDAKFQDDSNNWYLEQITIQKDYRGQGIGKELVRYFLDFCRKSEVKKVYAHVQEHNERSLKMFVNMGWEINGDPNKKIEREITIEYLFI